MVSVFTPGQMADVTKDFTRKIENMEREHTHGRMAASTKECGQMASSTEKVSIGPSPTKNLDAVDGSKENVRLGLIDHQARSVIIIIIRKSKVTVS